MFAYSRDASLILLSKLDESMWDIEPDGYPNSIRWNAGHVYITAEDYLHKADHTYEVKPPEWVDLFIDGTHPSQWKEEGPSKQEIISAFKEQRERILKHFKGKEQNKASEDHIIRTLNLNTVEAALQFVTWHEGIHLGILKSLNNALKSK